MSSLTDNAASTMSISALEPLVMPGSSPSLLDRWHAVTAAFPDRPAFSSPGASYSFGEADALSDAVAVRLACQFGDGKDAAPIGALLDHTAAALIGYLAIVKTGRVIVALDPHLPLDRLADICDLAGISVCVADGANAQTAAKLAERLTMVTSLDNLIAEAVGAGAGAGAGAVPRSDQKSPGQPAGADPMLAAGRARGGRDAVTIVFTSGSTGRPKGVVHTHDQLLNDAVAHAQRCRVGADDRVALVLPYSFSAGVTIMFGVLLNGAGVWSFDPRDGGARGLVSWIADQRLTAIYCTPHLLRSMVGVLPATAVLDSLRFVATIGEAVHGRDAEAIRAHLAPAASFFNLSGSSEASMFAMYEIPGWAPIPDGNLPVGRPLDNKEIAILREDSSVASPGEVGEIILISDYLSGGYWKDAAANAARYGVSADGRPLCRQGDLGRFDERGDLMLVGRADAAVKVRGYLVEPAEIEASFLATDGVAEVAVIPLVNPPAPTRLIAYVVPQPGLQPQSGAALRRSLRGRLPEYMVPAGIVLLSALPRTERGKVDRAALPPEPPRPPATRATTQRELAMATIWSEVLGLEVIEPDDDFMALGGDSLSAEELFAIVHERLGVSMVSTDLIASPTLSEFTSHVAHGSVTLPNHPDAVTLRSGGTHTPLFCFAGSGALALTFHPLSRHFPDRSVYSFQAHGLERRARPDWTVEASARRFVETIRVVQPHGPYILVGHSFGGLVALEIARLLADAGETVDLVGLVDTYLPRSASVPPLTSFTRMAERPGRSTTLRRGRAAAGRRVARLLPGGIAPDGLLSLELWSRRLHASFAGVIPFSGQRQFDAFFDHGVIASRRYQVQPYNGRTVLVLADGNPDGPAPWSRLLTGQHEFFTLPSEHSSVLREPYVSELAALLHAALT
jgi:acyl-coenzyme A synthetase/AMP-(fatty) acid ligase/thioesterase domain-containing protein/acyl carrier protein